MNLELLRVIAALAGTGAAAWEDHKTSFIDDKITFSMIGLGLGLNIWAWLGGGNWNFFVASVGPATALLAVGYLLYRAGQLGGGDVLLFTGLQLLVPFYPAATMQPVQNALGIQLPWLLSEVLGMWPFFFSIFMASSVIAMAGSGLQYAGLLLKKHPKLETLMPDWPMLALALVTVAGSFVLMGSTLSTGRTLLFAAVFLPGVFMVAFKKQIMDEVVVQEIAIEKIEDEDILAIDKLDQKLVKKYGLERVLTKEQVERLKKIRKETKISKFPVCKVLPRFGPYIFAALVACLVFGDVVFWVLTA